MREPFRGPRGWLLAVQALIGLAACSGDAPTAPGRPAAPHMPSAVLTAEGEAAWVACEDGNCVFQAEGHNIGAGCAAAVRGFTLFLNAAEQEVGTIRWAHPGTLLPDEVFTYGQGAGLIPADIVLATLTYRTEMAWTNVACPVPPTDAGS